jgi:predicted TIM-barrel fold metal-dependent hydrolase
VLARFPGKILLVHCTGTRFSAPEPMIDASLEYPAVPVVLAHLGRTDPPGRVIEHIARRGAGNVHVDTSALRNASMVGSAVATIGAARVLFGSDFPFYRPGDIISSIESSGITEEAVAMILESNARRLLGWV